MTIVKFAKINKTLIKFSLERITHMRAMSLHKKNNKIGRKLLQIHKPPRIDRRSAGWVLCGGICPCSYFPGFIIGFNDAMCFSGRRRACRQRGAYGDFLNLEICRSNSVLRMCSQGQGVRACVHRGECTLVYISVCIYNWILQKHTHKPPNRAIYIISE